jgi:hypothetical protein
MDFIHTCRGIVNYFYAKREAHEDYVVLIACAPNPLDFDGIDQVSARVVRRSKGEADVVVEEVSGHFTVDFALDALHKKVWPRTTQAPTPDAEYCDDYRCYRRKGHEGSCGGDFDSE